MERDKLIDLRTELILIEEDMIKIRDNPYMVKEYEYFDSQIKLVRQKIDLIDNKLKKPKILCIVGESGTGKSMISEHIQKTYDIPLIKSYTTRKRRTGESNTHTFLDDEKFDKIKKEDMIAFTDFGGNRYCCTKQDVKDLNTYVIDEDGLIMLKDKFSGVYDIKSLRLIRNNRLISEERALRDEGRFNLPLGEFDYILTNEKTKEELFDKLHHVVDNFFYKSNVQIL